MHGGSYLCNAVIGYDGPTGLGTPNSAAAFDSSGGGGGTTNTPPSAAFMYSCTDLNCAFTDTSTDDLSIASRSWDFGDGATSTETNPGHTYASGGTYTVKLTVTDNDGATSTVSHSVTVTSGSTAPIQLSASGYKLKGRNTVDLSWTADSSISTFDVHLSDGSVKTVTSSSYTDETGDRGGATYTYRVCAAGSTVTCSDTITVIF